MNIQSLHHLISVLRDSYTPDFEFDQQLLVTQFRARSERFDQIFIGQDHGISLPHLIHAFTSTLEPNDRYLEVNHSGDWTLFLAAISHNFPISASIVQIGEESELDFDDPRLLQFSDSEFEALNLLQVEPGISLSNLLTDLQDAEPMIQTAIVLLPGVKDYRLHFLNLLTIASSLSTSALILTLGANYPWIKQANQDFIGLYNQTRLILDLSLKNHNLGNDVLGVQIMGWGEEWVDFYTEHIDFNPHYLQHFFTDHQSIPYGLESSNDQQYQTIVKNTLQTAIEAHQQGDRDQARVLYAQVLQQDLNQDLAWANLGTIAFDQSDRKEALQLTYIAALINPHSDLYWRNLGINYQRSRDFRQSIYFFQKALETNDRAVVNTLNLAKVLEQSNQYQAADLILQRGIEQFPDDLVLYIKRLLLKPLIYHNSEDLQSFHDRLAQNLEETLEYLQNQGDKLRSLGSHQIDEIFEAVDLAYFAYHGMNLVTIARNIAAIMSHILEMTQPELSHLIHQQPSPVIKPKIRIGYLGTCLRDHVIGYLSKGWLEFHDRSRFEIFSYSINPDYSPEDPIAASFQHHSDRCYIFSDRGLQVIQQILQDQIDILVFLDLNVGTRISHYALLRLAPIQCGFWGNPMTSGSPAIDYFLSSQLMESWQGQDHYTEKLVYLPQLGSCSLENPISIPPLTAADFGLDADRVLYLFTQTLLKQLPQYDYIFAEIARQVSNAQFIILARPDEYLAQVFLDRLEPYFAHSNLDLKQYCKIFPALPKAQFYAFQSFVHVALDSLGWSGGVTTLDAIACDLPVVTYPGEFMRGRHSYGILQLLGVTETIAHSEQEYIEIAVQLGNDRPWREQIRQKIQQHKPKLYDTQTCVRGLENFYQQIYTGS
jgi:protein O-GlcNAc transferase